jgi:hypothetical protein
LILLMPTPEYKWDAKQGKYRSRGKFVKASTVQKAADQYIQAKQGKTADAMFELLRSGAANVKDIQLLGEREIAKAHLAQAMAAKGGRLQMAPSDFGRVGSYVKKELQHWRTRMKAIAEGQPLDGRVKQSFRAFIAASGATFQKIEQIEAERRGETEYRNILDDGARSCSECPAITAQGWQPVGSLPERGDRQCSHNCRCHWEYRNPATGEIRE